MKRKSTILLLAVTLLLATGCPKSAQSRVETAFNVGLPRVVDRFRAADKLTQDEAEALKGRSPLIVAAIKAKDFAAAAVHLGELAKLRIKNQEAKLWLDDLLAVTSVILGVDIPSDSPQIRGVMAKSVPKQREPNLSNANLKRLEELTK